MYRNSCGGGGIRLQGAILAIGLSGILFFLFNGLTLKQILQATVTFSVIIISIKCSDFLLLDKEEKIYREWEDARVRVIDYHALLPEYEGSREFYLENGISDVNFQIIKKRNMPEDWEIYSYEHIKAIGDKESLFLPLRTAMLMARNCIRFSPKIWLWCVIMAVFSFIISDNKYRIRIILCLMAGRAAVLVLALLGRIPVRISDGIAFILIVYLTYSILDGLRLKQNKLEKGLKQILYVGAYITVLAFSLRTLYLNYRDCFLRTTIICDTGYDERMRLREVLEEIESRKENIYLLSCRGGVPSLSVTGAFSFFQHIPDGFTTNIYYIFGGQNRQPYYINELKEAGIDNPMTALFEKDNVYSDYDEEVLLFLKSNYGEDIEMKVVEEINGYQIVKYYRNE